MKEESIKQASERLHDLVLDMGGRLYRSNARRAVRGFLEIEKIGDANFQAVIMQGVLDKVLRVEGDEIIAVLATYTATDGKPDNDDVGAEARAPVAPVIVVAPVTTPTTLGPLLAKYYQNTVLAEQSASDKKYARLAMARIVPLTQQEEVPSTIERAMSVVANLLCQSGMTTQSARQYSRSLRPYLQEIQADGTYFQEGHLLAGAK